MKYSKKEYTKILTRYHAFGDCDDFDTLLSMISNEFKDYKLRDKVISKSQKLENDYNNYYDADDRDKFFDDKYDY